MFSPLLQKGLSEVNIEVSVRDSTTTTEISISRNNEPSRNFKNVCRVGLKLKLNTLTSALWLQKFVVPCSCYC